MEPDSPNTPDYALALETSSAHGSVAIGRGGDVLEARTFSAPMRHAIEFLPTIDALCRTYDVQPAQVAAIHVSIGPGSFTGLRIGVTAARTIALAAARTNRPPIRCTAVPTLEVIAQNALQIPEPAQHVAVLIDAKRSRTYAALFTLNDKAYVPCTDPAEVDPIAFLTGCPDETVVLGRGAHVYSSAIQSTKRAILPESLFDPRAETVFLLGAQRAAQNHLLEPRDLVPSYIRPPEAEERWTQRNQSA